jgi:hypothetical protein
MTSQEPIPVEIVDQFVQSYSLKIHGRSFDSYRSCGRDRFIASKGADYELDQCCLVLKEAGYGDVAIELHNLRRPKPPSLKQQALESLTKIEDNKATYLDSSIVRRALEALADDLA